MTSHGDEMRLPLSKIRRRILDIVRRNPEIDPSDVADEIGVHVETVKRNYRWLAAHGFGEVIPGLGRGNTTRFYPQ